MLRAILDGLLVNEEFQIANQSAFLSLVYQRNILDKEKQQDDSGFECCSAQPSCRVQTKKIERLQRIENGRSDF